MYPNLTNKEASLFCTKLKLALQIKNRLKEISLIEVNPERDHSTKYFTKNLMNGDYVMVDHKEFGVLGCSVNYNPNIKLIPDETTLPDLYYRIKVNGKKVGPVDWETFEKLIPLWKLEFIDIWDQIQSTWIPLSFFRLLDF